MGEPRKPLEGEEPDDRVSLWPLDPITALRAALRVDPKSEPVEDETEGAEAPER